MTWPSVDEPELRTRPLTVPARVTFLLLKSVNGNPGLADDFRRWAGDLGEILGLPDGSELFAALLRYIFLVGEIRPGELRDLIAELGPEAEEAYVTTAEMLRAEGEARGRAEGEARGRAEGEARGRAGALVQLLTLRFGPLTPDALDAVRDASADKLETWTARVLTADTVEDVLRGA
jgi:hypothetical protein